MPTSTAWAARPLSRRHGLQWLAAWPLWTWAQNAPASAPSEAFALPQGVTAAPPAVEPILARDWPRGQSPEGYLVSEKFDGVRALWDGRQLRFRSGRPIAAPAQWLAGLPARPLDGELWLGYGEFDGLSGRVRRQGGDLADWRGVQYLVFDTPDRSEVFEARWDMLGRLVDSAGVPWLRRVRQARIHDAQALDAELARVTGLGGEGLMLHKADALWQPGRSGVLFKYKPEQDAEAQVLGYHKGQGRLSGKVGALWVETAEGQRFAVGSGLSDALRQNPPPVGSWITYRYRDTTPSGLPRFATFVRVRPEE